MTLLEQLRARRQALLDESRTLLELAAAENRDLTPDAELPQWQTLQTDLDAVEGRITETEAAEARAAAIVGANAPVDAASAATPTSSTSVKGPTTYRKHGPFNFLLDAFSARQGDTEAGGRIFRHQAEMRDELAKRGEGLEDRVAGVGNFSGLVVPIYMTDDYAPLARAGRPFADRLPSSDLPPVGMTVNISRITTGSTTDVQALEGDAVSETDIDDTLLTIPVVTIAGAETLSFQALDRGALAAEIVLEDMTLSYHTRLNWQLINGTGANNQHLGVLNQPNVNAVTYTDATPTVAELVPKVADGIQQINGNRFAPGTFILMAPRRWGWITAAVDGAQRPLVVPNPYGPMNAQGVGDGAAYGNIVGTFMGLPVITDGSVPTNLGAGTDEDRIVIQREYDQRLWEDPGSPLFLRFDHELSPSKKSLVDVAVVYGYSAATFGRYPKSTTVISGTGLKPPSF